ncbi:MAG: helix-turn-helix domain-containing protein [Candidatus Syntropharchaeia archaeon]
MKFKVKVKKKTFGQIYREMLEEPPPEREDGLDKIYSKEDLERYDKFIRGFDDPLKGMAEYHRRYGEIFNNPTRREILKTMIDGEKTFEEIAEMTKLDEKTLYHHLGMMGFCVEVIKREGKEYFKLTKEGERIKNF